MKDHSLFTHIWTQSPVFESVLRSVQIVAATEATTLILGESGTGKELVARALHDGSGRRARPYVPVNCASFSEALAESQLFGHKRGAFTGALCDHVGQIRSADGGTLFLDEIAELSLPVQAKLLRFLETGEVMGLGGSQSRRVDVRLVAATHRDLLQMVEQGLFRADLFYRLQVVPIELPPLRMRQGDIDWLLARFMNEFAERYTLHLPRLTSKARGVIRRHPWPGNVRELRNMAERLVILHSGKSVDVENLPYELRTPDSKENTTRRFHLPENGVDLEAIESDLLRQALLRTGGNKSRAARLLNLSRDTFLYRLKKLSIQ
ncbi:MAG: sigma-54-dependent Fis family transcriptional regulator [Halothiobacillus sp. 14-56-357]|jgi:transcriptional regulator with PAS, ATPase and Fis domain|uniref:sigma-54 interaction domain-containing protein n=1 Tax=Halothiobacillus sp. 15-55-196 TaxID=1970382 RepID=UPI000BCE4A1C|nr:sigma-54 dependent transcriptional regulator [Halothiobacillus sp. 15-55-196]OZB36536.1 MAG: sigma-54-dependent Fis family transcriptional regulator [Halothiobacillus sp. 15-55-196]OZB57306.1 MAG: sigma-54-dependent Fis family transcriptional regulator [Halothiobacillus sp. 14-56-357]OZB79090.1 MAG: sigma-54-dependent Fis family transcriptional regulator [Halothiobacillus sp. 13-55-115]